MPIAPSPAPVDDDDRRMGSEYSSARAYLSKTPRSRVGPRPRPDDDPQHGSNDSDFGMLDQAPD